MSAIAAGPDIMIGDCFIHAWTPLEVREVTNLDARGAYLAPTSAVDGQWVAPVVLEEEAAGWQRVDGVVACK